jgi:immunoglobulin-binding protein 1
METKILAQAPPPTAQNGTSQPDPRRRQGASNEYSDRLDTPLAQLLTSKTGPILDKSGRPLRPFTLLDSRQRLQQGVFRPDHNLPTMSIDEYLEEEKRRGGIIEGGGEKSGIKPQIDEDNMDKMDEETMKARAWDDFKDDNPRGSGNTLNRG